MKKILITGANSYIGTSFEKWVSQYANQYSVETIDMKNDTWKEKNFSYYDVVFHVAGIAHVSSNPKLEQLYFKINRDLAIETAQRAKDGGVKQFIFMSSIIVYGKSLNKTIDSNTIPKPNNIYGKSKLQAEAGIVTLQDETFNVVIIRPPMIYGQHCKGNYPRLSKIAKSIPIFPDIDNERSMLHIDNLCEFVRLMINNHEKGIYFPQNEEYVNTSAMVRTIAGFYGKKVILTKVLNPALKIFEKHFFIINKVFGNLIYEKKMSNYKVNYRVWNFKESIAVTEQKQN